MLSFITSFNKYELETYHEPDIILAVFCYITNNLKMYLLKAIIMTSYFSWFLWDKNSDRTLWERLVVSATQYVRSLS